MRRADSNTMTEEIARFQADLRRLAFEIAHAVVRRELDGRRAEIEPARRPGRPKKQAPRRQKVQKVQKAQKARAPRRQKTRTPKKARTSKRKKERPERQLELLPTGTAEPTAPIAAEADANAEQQPAASAIPGKRRRWTRDSIIEELAKWMVTSTVIDASFVTRHGPPGLAAAARRIFGRFDAALNVASLHVAKLYPDGPPAARGGARQQAAAAAAASTEG